MIGIIDSKTAKVRTRHGNRIINSLLIDDTLFNIVNTKHGVYRVLERKHMELSDLSRIILSVGIDELKHHMNMAKSHYNAQESWERQIDYVISIYDVTNEIVPMIGLHPHLKRITIVTVIPRVKNVISNNIYAAYRVDTVDTSNTYINHTVPEGIVLKRIIIN